jgi:hypothetical protein
MEHHMQPSPAMHRSALLLMVALGVSSLGVACSGTDSAGIVGSEDDLTSGVGTGTYLVESAPWGGYYASRLTFSAGKKYEAEMVSSSGDKSLIAGSYDILPARPNNPQSPVQSDKPTLYLSSDSGGANVTFEFDKLPEGRLKLYHSARSVSFTVKKDPSWHAEATNAKVIACTGPAVNVKQTLDQAQNQRGTLTITRKASADRHDPPAATVPMIKVAGSEVPGYVYFEGSKGEQDYYVNMSKTDFERGTGSVTMHMNWAEGGQERGVGTTCAFAH